MASRDELTENSNLLLGLAFAGTIWLNKDLCSRRTTQNGC